MRQPSPSPILRGQALLAAIEAELGRCLTLAEKRYGRVFARPKLSSKLRGHTAGKANVLKWEIRLNRTLLLTPHQQEVIYQTVPHELAHLVDFALHPENFIRRRKGERRSVHGPTWQAIMHLFGRPPNRCHTMTTTAARKTHIKRYIYCCPECRQPILIGPGRHRRMQHNRRVGYRLRACGHLIDRRNYTGPAPVREREAPQDESPEERNQRHCT